MKYADRKSEHIVV